MTLYKLATAAIFHDILIKSNALAHANDLEEVKKSKDLLLLDTFEEYQSHPIRCASLVTHLPDHHPDMDLMIRHHHEKPDGKGFPAGLSPQQLPPLSCLFIIAHEFVDATLASSTNIDIHKHLTQYTSRAHMGPFKDIARALQNKLGKAGSP